MSASGRLFGAEQEAALRSLVDHLDRGRPRQEGAWQGWRIAPVVGGRNNLLYRARGPGGDLAIKFYRRDGRDRAGREYHSLLVLRQAGLEIAPQPMLLDRERYGQPVGVQRWIEGQTGGPLPEEEGPWQALSEHLASIHSVTPQRTPIKLRRGTIHAASAEEARQRVYEQAAHLPAGAQPDSLRRLLERLRAATLPDWPSAPVALCRLDNNLANYVWRPAGWASVDWEYSGWNDPAFDVANLASHVAWLEVPAWRWVWFVEGYARLVKDETVALRAEVYRRIMLVWWAARLARYLYELPRGRDQRLADWPEGWQAEIETKYEGYLRRQETEAQRLARLEDVRLPEDIDYSSIRGLSREVVEKLSSVRPRSLGQASRVSGVTPVAVSVLMTHLNLAHKRRQQRLRGDR